MAVALHADCTAYGEYSAHHKELLHTNTNVPYVMDIGRIPSVSSVFDQLSYRSGQKHGWVYKEVSDTTTLKREFRVDTQTQQLEDIALSRSSKTAKLIQAVKHTFNLSDEELADTLQSTRKSVYNWQQDLTKPNKTKINRILECSQLAEHWVSNGYPTSSDIDHSYRAQLIGLITADSLNQDELMYLGSSMLLEAAPSAIEDPFV